MVTAASVSDKAGAKLLLIKLFDAFGTLQIMWADSGYDGAPLARCRFARTIAAVTVEIVKRTSPHTFQVVCRRWVVERTFGWLMRYRRTDHAEAMIYGHRHHHDQPPEPRWGGDHSQQASQLKWPHESPLSTGSKRRPTPSTIDAHAHAVLSCTWQPQHRRLPFQGWQ